MAATPQPAALGVPGMGPEQLQQMQMLMSMMAAGGAFPPVAPQMHQALNPMLSGQQAMDQSMMAQAFNPMAHGQQPIVDPAMMQSVQMLQYIQSAGLAAQAPPYPGNPGVLAGLQGLQPTMMSEPTVSVCVEGMRFQYQLTADDLMKVFRRYGQVKRVSVDEQCSSAKVTFHRVQDAQTAIQDLDEKVLNGLDGTLRIRWVSECEPAQPTHPYASMGFPGLIPGLPGFPQAGPLAAAAAAVPTGGIAQPLPTAGDAHAGMHAGAQVAAGVSGMGGVEDSYAAMPHSIDAKPPHVKGQKKFTCRFLIGIENDKEFQVARRLIGSKGANMKRIVKITEAKLRLRGQGSGYFEGAGQKESSEPLQLCVSCTSQEGYKTAVRQVEELLGRVYDEYRQFCRDNGKLFPEDLKVNFSENQLVYSSNRGGGGGGGGGCCGGQVGDGDAGAGGGQSPKRRGDRRAPRSKGGGGGKPVPAGNDGSRGDPGPNAPPTEEIEQLICERNEARRACNFTEADRIRDNLHSRGVALMDEPGGRGKGAEVTTWRYWRD